MSSQPTEAQYAFDAIQALEDKSVDSVYRQVQEWTPMAVAAAAAATAVGAAVEYQELELEPGWSNLEGDWAPARYRRLVNVVRLSGTIVHDGPLTGPSNICRLPEGAYPDAGHIYLAASDGSVSRLNLHGDGTLEWRTYLSGTTGARELAHSRPGQFLDRGGTACADPVRFLLQDR